MIRSVPFSIYNASAGSGKTFTLTKQYLTHVLADDRPSAYKNLLALTFTNKAVAEMKTRIVEALVSFTKDDCIQHPPVMLEMIAKETLLDIPVLHERSKKVLNHLLHHYAQFSVETIDHFNHRLIRTFARDLQLPAHFEISLDAPQLIAEAVDNVISKAGQDEEITKVLVQFALQKTDDDKSWDISYDIYNTASLLLNETDAAQLQQYKKISLNDFQNIQVTLEKNYAAALLSLKTLAKETLKTIAEAGLEKTDFNGGSRAYFPAYLEKLASGDLSVSYGAVWQETMGEKPMYPKTKTTDFIAQTIEALTPAFITTFQKSKELVTQLWLYENMLANIVPLSVINLVQQELEVVKEQYNVLPISEFNTLINDQIKDQPAPFIYERLGDRYHHFFIDEFQDTSLLQWQNLVPLVDNAISQQWEDNRSGSLLLVGDAKQAIYRWRGGLPEQFINLYGNYSPFSTTNKVVKNLDTNWRSREEIITFNNALFSFIATSFGNDVHSELYAIGNSQTSNPKPESYVEIQFITPQDKEDAHLLYGEAVLQTIQKLQQEQYALEDICILTRTKKNGVALSTFLMENDVKVVSSETLLLQFSPLVTCIVHALQFSLFPENEQAKVWFLEFVHAHFIIANKTHDFLSELLPLKDSAFSKRLASYGVSFSEAEINNCSLYQACEYCIRQLDLNRTSDAYLFAFMDLVLDFENQPQAGKINFLEYWDRKKDSASISAVATKNAVTLMTIHKSKGLEFPVVLFPYADTEIYQEMNPKAWYPITHERVDTMLINYKKAVEFYGEKGKALYQERRNTLELDNFNLLYVTLTRAVSQLYIFSELPKTLQLDAPKSFNNTLVSFLSHQGLWNANQLQYHFGNFKATSALQAEHKKTSENTMLIPPRFISSTPEYHNVAVAATEALLWDTPFAEAITIGNLLHDTMEKIYTKSDIATVFALHRQTAIFSEKELSQLEEIVKKITSHPEVEHLYRDTLLKTAIYNERDIVTATQKLIRPDRLNFFEDKKVTVVDYKTGVLDRKHESQLNSYASALEDMGFSVIEKILIYAQSSEILINKI